MSLRYPLAASYQYTNATNTQVTQFSDSIANATGRTVNGQPVFSSSFKNANAAASTLLFDASGAVLTRTGQQSSQDVSYTDSIGSCYDRHIVTAGAALTTFTDGTACGSNNVLNWLAQPDGAPAQTLLRRFDLAN